jgi:hypothetical protein
MNQPPLALNHRSRRLDAGRPGVLRGDYDQA